MSEAGHGLSRTAQWAAGIVAGLIITVLGASAVGGFRFARSVDQRLTNLEATLTSTQTVEELRRVSRELARFEARYDEARSTLERDLERFEQAGGGRFTKSDGRELREELNDRIDALSGRIDRLEERRP